MNLCIHIHVFNIKSLIQAVVLGLAEGVQAIKCIPPFEQIILGHETVKQTALTYQKGNLSWVSSDKQSYSFLSPWLALNEKNYDQYKRLKGWPEKRNF